MHAFCSDIADSVDSIRTRVCVCVCVCAGWLLARVLRLDVSGMTARKRQEGFVARSTRTSGWLDDDRMTETSHGAIRSIPLPFLLEARRVGNNRGYRQADSERFEREVSYVKLKPPPEFHSHLNGYIRA